MTDPTRTGAEQIPSSDGIPDADLEPGFDEQPESQGDAPIDAELGVDG